jgi:adenine-specific DNA-methyltransferase
MARGKRATKPTQRAESYKHPESTNPMRPEVGTQAQFKKKKPPVTYRYDSSLSPALDWDGQNPAREQGEAALRHILKAESLEEAKRAAEQLKAISRPFLNWAGRAERLSFEVPTLPLFIHERLSTKAIIETLSTHKRDKQQTMFELFGDPQHSVTDQVLRAYEHRDKWVNRMILGDSLVVMSSLLHYEGLGGQVQMIYMDPPYGVKFGSNFQPFVRKRDVTHNDDEDMTREPEMVQAYRDTWELSLHSYLTYLRDRLLLARDLLAPSGSIFVQISDENIHHVREVLDEIFGHANSCGLIAFRTTGGQSTSEEPRSMTAEELEGSQPTPPGWRVLAHDTLYSQGAPSDSDETTFEWRDQVFRCPPNTHWKPGVKSGGMGRLANANRLMLIGNTLRYKRYVNDFPIYLIDNVWNDTAISGFARKKEYVVETSPKVVARCLLMTTSPGDLVLDPTCGSGTTACVAEQWGRRWITIDTSRVPLALARQRLLTATFPWYQLNDEARGPAAGFVYKRKQNSKGEEVGGIVPHVTLKSIANNEPPEEEVLVDRPEKDEHITRVTGAFCVEATIPTPVGIEEGGSEATAPTPACEDRGFEIPDSKKGDATYVDRMLEILRKSPVLRLAGNNTVTLKNIRSPAKTLSLSAEALVDATAAGQKPTLQDAVQEAAEKSGQALALSQKPVALVFGPENGAISERLVQEAAKEAGLKNYTHLYVVGFAIQPNARQLIENCEAVVGIPATYIQATPDLMMGDLLKNMRSSQIFSVCGLPEIKISHRGTEAQRSYQVELLGLDVFDPITMENVHRNGNDVPAWFLDTDYNGLCFHVSQAFFPRTSAWDNLKKALKGEYEESVWDHLAGTTSAPFEAGEQRQIAVKVIDDRGNELMVVEKLA